MSAGERSTFADLFERHAGVCIPILQRDYAQGRPAEAEVRMAFLHALREALGKAPDDPTLPLDLDFVYGSVDGDGAFTPLDGQQRLTTLLLLHWYLAARDGVALDFLRKPPPARGARFTYEVRPSSREFFDALLDWQPRHLQRLKVSDEITDQPWFFLRWKLDPTIQSTLVMLDEIQASFADSTGFYERLTTPDRPAITFQLLDLHDFGLSDDLYIKMNARGKALTGFEAFKAQLEHHIDSVIPDDRFELHGRQVCASEYISHRIDTAWADVLWSYRDPRTALFDDQFMNLVRAVVTVTRRPESPGYALMQQLRDSGATFSFARYLDAGCLDEGFTRTFVTLLDAWSGHESGIRPLLPEGCVFDECALVERMLKDANRLTYAEQLQFGAYCAFLTCHREKSAQAFGEWMRVLVNLSANTPYDSLGDFIRSMQSVHLLLGHAPAILPYLVSPAGSSLKGFYGQQVREERMKASLLLRAKHWRGAVELAEGHGYFAGQVEFLLDFAGVLAHWNDQAGFDWTAEREAECLKRFVDYRDKAFAVFDESGLRELPRYLWERALLAHGDYLLPVRSNHSFLRNAERDESWKRLLRAGPRDEPGKRQLVRDVFDGIDLTRGVESSLADIVNSRVPKETWRAILVQDPRAIAYCSQRYVRKSEDDRLYLMRKMRMSGDHVELFTYVIYCRLVDMKKAAFTPQDDFNYAAVSTDAVEPCAVALIAGRRGRLSVRMHWDCVGIEIAAGPREGTAEPPLPQGFVDEMRERGFYFRTGRLLLSGPLAEVESVLVDLAERARTWDFEPAPDRT